MMNVEYCPNCPCCTGVKGKRVTELESKLKIAVSELEKVRDWEDAVECCRETVVDILAAIKGDE